MLSKISLGVSSAALEDIYLISAWYELQKPGLRYRFVSELELSIQKIVTAPEAYSRYDVTSFVRRYIMDIFPYKIFYHYNSFHVEIIALIHTSRSSRYIKRRLK
jgi:plasmid stabilization system protein ParE